MNLKSVARSFANPILVSGWLYNLLSAVLNSNATVTDYPATNETVEGIYAIYVIASFEYYLSSSPFPFNIILLNA